MVRSGQVLARLDGDQLRLEADKAHASLPSSSAITGATLSCTRKDWSHPVPLRI